MCVGFRHGYEDFRRFKDAAVALVPGSAVSFSRVAFSHFAIFLGWAWSKGGNSDPIPLLCHLSGDASTRPVASVRLDDFRDIVQHCNIRVYSCTCSASKRSQVILECLYRVGSLGFNIVTNNCEHFVRQVICGERVSYQIRKMLASPFIKLPRMFLGMLGTACSSSSSICLSRLEETRSLCLLNPELDLVEILVSNGGLQLRGVRLNSTCTREFAFSSQIIFKCSSCYNGESVPLCKPCQKYCHKNCDILDGQVAEDACQCSHAEGPSRLNFRDENSHCRDQELDSALVMETDTSASQNVKHKLGSDAS